MKKQNKKKANTVYQLSDMQRSSQINHEVIAGILLYVAYFIWWTLTGYGLGTRSNMHYILGMPDWFFYSCIIGYIWFSIAAILLVRFCFRNFDLDGEEEAEVEE